MWSTRKRKHRTSPTLPDVDDRLLHIQAYEANIRCNPTSARSLEANGPHIGEALIKHSTADSEIWLDRYDVRLILDSVSTQPGEPRSPSPSGWSDLPSDTEDTFFFGQTEAEDYRRDKRRRLMENAREERLRALEQLEPSDEPQEACWASDEEPWDEVQKDLMQRTALHIQSSPNPAQLEMRILANHGADRRFAFLRGRWSKCWKDMTDRARKETAKQDEPAGLGGLAGYGSDGDSGGSNGEQG